MACFSRVSLTLVAVRLYFFGAGLVQLLGRLSSKRCIWSFSDFIFFGSLHEAPADTVHKDKEIASHDGDCTNNNINNNSKEDGTALGLPPAPDYMYTQRQCQKPQVVRCYLRNMVLHSYACITAALLCNLSHSRAPFRVLMLWLLRDHHKMKPPVRVQPSEDDDATMNSGTLDVEDQDQDIKVGKVATTTETMSILVTATPVDENVQHQVHGVADWVDLIHLNMTRRREVRTRNKERGQGCVGATDYLYCGGGVLGHPRSVSLSCRFYFLLLESQTRGHLPLLTRWTAMMTTTTAITSTASSQHGEAEDYIKSLLLSHTLVAMVNPEKAPQSKAFNWLMDDPFLFVDKENYTNTNIPNGGLPSSMICIGNHLFFHHTITNNNQNNNQMTVVGGYKIIGFLTIIMNVIGPLPTQTIIHLPPCMKCRKKILSCWSRS